MSMTHLLSGVRLEDKPMWLTTGGSNDSQQRTQVVMKQFLVEFQVGKPFQMQYLEYISPNIFKNFCHIEYPSLLPYLAAGYQAYMVSDHQTWLAETSVSSMTFPPSSALSIFST